MTDADSRASDLMDEMDSRLLRLIHTRLNSFVKWDVMRYFYAHPHTAETPDGLAHALGRDVRLIEPELRALTQDGLLLADDMGDLTVFALAEDDDVRRLVGDFLAACENRQFRIRAIYHIIRGLG